MSEKGRAVPNFIQSVKSMFQAGRPSDAPEVVPSTLGPVTILVIDDNQEYLASTRYLLEREGYNVITSNAGVKGLEMLRQSPENLRVVLLDYNMPEFDGLQTLNYVRDLRPQVKVIAITGESLTKVPAAFREGVDAFITKPFHPMKLLTEIRRLQG